MFSTAHKSKGSEMHTILEDPRDTSSEEQPVSTGSFHRQIAASLMQHHQSVDRARRSVQPVSPASYSSSIELNSYDVAATPTSSLDYKGRTADSTALSLETSPELFQVLNRIWCLEEQHASCISLVKSLKFELNNARTRIKQLLQEKLMDRRVIEVLMNEVAEHDRLHSAVQSLRGKLEEERKLRKRSEFLHHKLAREISEVKSSLSMLVKKLETERRTRVLLEDLCDEFAVGIKHITNDVQIQTDHFDSLFFHISEVWLDGKLQMKHAEETHKNVEEKGSVVDKLRLEIETFLKTRRASDLGGSVNMPLNIPKGGGSNKAVCASENVNEEDDNDSINSDTCFELNQNLHRYSCNEIHAGNVDESIEGNCEGETKRVSKTQLI